MSWTATKSWFASTSAQLSLIYAGLLLGAFLASAAIIHVSLDRIIEGRVRSEIGREFTGLAVIAGKSGDGAVAAELLARSRFPGARDYWLASPAGKVLIGHHAEMGMAMGYRILDVERRTRPGTFERLLVYTGRLKDGSVLSIGQEMRIFGIVRSSVYLSIAGVGAASCLAALLAGVFFTRRALRKVAMLTATIDGVSVGDLSLRYGGAGNSDIDRIGAGVNDMLSRIEDLVADLRRVSRDVAHDLRTPLSQLRQRLERAAESKTIETKDDAIESAQLKTREIMRVFDAILRLSEIEAGGGYSHFTPFQPAEMIDRIVDAYRPDVEEGGRLIKVGSIVGATIHGDSEQLALALCNLIENAMRHTPEGTSIMIRMEALRDQVELVVEDDGPGVPDEALAEITKPFARLDASRTSPGAGLGLSIVAAIARRHQAHLVIERAMPGLRVILRFPAPEVAGARHYGRDVSQQTS